MSKRTLFQLIELENQIENQLAENDGEVTDELNALMETFDTSMPAKIDGYFNYIEKLEQIANQAELKYKYFQKVKRAAENAQDRLKESLKTAIELSGKQELHGHNSIFKLADHNPKMEINMDMLPYKYKIPVTSYEPNKAAIKTALVTEKTIPGVLLTPVKRLLKKRK